MLGNPADNTLALSWRKKVPEPRPNPHIFSFLSTFEKHPKQNKHNFYCIFKIKCCTRPHHKKYLKKKLKVNILKVFTVSELCFIKQVKH